MAERFPDFVTGGALKCGITSGHFIFGRNPGTGLSDEEIVYFDVDDLITHSANSRTHLNQKLHHTWFTWINPLFLKAERPPPMRAATRAYLEDHLSRRNDGLSAFLGRNLAAIWPGFNG